MIEKASVIRDPQVQAFMDQAKSAETMSIIVQIKPVTLAIEMQDQKDPSARATDVLPSPAAAEAVHASYKEQKTAMARAQRWQQKLRTLKHALERLGLEKQATYNALAGTIALDVTPEQLKKLISEADVGFIVENRYRYRRPAKRTRLD